MKIRQNVRHWAAKKALTTPIIGEMAKTKLADMHTDIFLERADESSREDRREHLDAFFTATMETYLAALQEGYPESAAREITHIQANFDFFLHGWTEMMEIPAEELEPHYRRYEEFFNEYEITIDDPLGVFDPAGGLPDAPATPEKLTDPAYEHAIDGFADDVYVQTDEGLLQGHGTSEPADVTPQDAPGIEPEDESSANPG